MSKIKVTWTTKTVERHVEIYDIDEFSPELHVVFDGAANPMAAIHDADECGEFYELLPVNEGEETLYQLDVLERDVLSIEWVSES